jgi:hypothetical protein
MKPQVEPPAPTIREAQAPVAVAPSAVTQEAGPSRGASPPHERLSHWSDNEWECRMVEQMIRYAASR